MSSARFVDRLTDHDHPLDWSDTVPVGIRSEAFVEDLSDTAPVEPDIVRQREHASSPRRLSWLEAARALFGRRSAAA
jgi:hypothetical protein